MRQSCLHVFLLLSLPPSQATSTELIPQARDAKSHENSHVQALFCAMPCALCSCHGTTKCEGVESSRRLLWHGPNAALQLICWLAGLALPRPPSSPNGLRLQHRLGCYGAINDRGSAKNSFVKVLAMPCRRRTAGGAGLGKSAALTTANGPLATATELQV